MKNKLIKTLSLILSGLVILSSLSINGYAESYKGYDGETITLPSIDDSFTKYEISTAEDLCNLSTMCRLDSNSDSLYVELKNDISLADVDFMPIGYFNGHFNGKGHTISSLTCENKAEPVGLFSTIGKGAVVKNLNVAGNIQPSESCNYVGAIAGENKGIIYNCSFTGVVTGNNFVGGLVGKNDIFGTVIESKVSGAVRGDYMTGGIVGLNNGSVIGCENEAIVNTESVENGLDIANLDIEFTLDLTKLANKGNQTSQDMGGICGYSSGVISGCKNNGEVGYNHQGYNVGGIAGRSSGFVFKSENYAHILGRKDLGGIVGQMEPYIQETISPSKLNVLHTQLDEMQGLCDATRADCSDAGDQVSKRVEKITDSLSDAQESASELTKNAIDEYDDIKNSSLDDKKGEASEYIKDKSEETGSTIKDKITSDDISKETEKEKIKDQANEKKENASKTEEELYDSLKELNKQIDLLNKEAQGYGDKIDADLRAINRKYDEIQSTIESFKDVNYEIKDTSLVNPELIILGAVRDCVNFGEITGDLNAGGIAGVMGEESSLDPEDEISLSIDLDTHKDYEYKAVIDGCVNKGSVYTKRNYAGGISARAEVGFIKDSENYGDILAEGNYAGGIAASAQITIRGCYEKSNVSAVKHVGGILGEGTNATEDVAGSLVADSRALVCIEGAQKFFGAISGSPDGEYDGNVFAHTSLKGLGAYSAEGKAYPVSYEELISKENIPEEFAKINLIFVADGAVLKKTEVSYGDAVSKEEYPNIPSKRGYFAKWDKEDIDSIVIDTKVEAIYTPFVSALASEEERASKRPVFYAEGNFTDTDKLVISKLETPSFTPEALDSRDISRFFYDREVEEQWEVTVPDDGSSVHILRYLPTGISAKTPEIYVGSEGSFERAELTDLGSFYAFLATGEKVEVAVVSASPIYSSFAIVFAAIAILIFIVVFITVICQRAKKRKNKIENANENEAPVESNEAEDKEDNTKANIEDNHIEEKHMEEKPIEEKPIEEKPKKKAFKVVFHIVNTIIFIGIIAGTVYLAKNPSVVSAKIAYLLTIRAAGDEQSQMDVDLLVKIGDFEAKSQAYVSKANTEGTKITCIETNGIALYKCEDRLYLADGTAFEISEVIPEYENVFETLLGLLKDSRLSYAKVDGGTKHSIELSPENAKLIFNEILGEYVGDVSTIDDATITLFSSNWKIKSVSIRGNALTAKNEHVLIDCNIDLYDSEEGKEIQIPKSVMMAISAKEDAFAITPEMLKLVYAFGRFNTLDPSVCDINISANGGIVSLNDTLSWYRTKVKNEWINCVSKNGISLYYNEKGACTAKGVSLTETQAMVVDSASIIDTAFTLCISGNLEINKTGDSIRYRLDLSQDELAEILSSLAPEMDALEKVLSSGYVEILVKDESVSGITVRVTGEANLIVMTQPFTISATVVPVAANGSSDYKIPTEVIDTLTGK